MTSARIGGVESYVATCTLSKSEVNSHKCEIED